MSRSLCSIRTSESNLLRRELMLSYPIINLFEFLSLVFSNFLRGSESDSCSDLVNNFSILYYKYLELDEFYCYYHDPINSILTESQRKCSQKLLSRICSSAPYFHLRDFAELNWNDRCKQCFDGNTYLLNDCSLHQLCCLICHFMVLVLKLKFYSCQTSVKVKGL